MIVHVKIVILTFLEWSINLNHYFVIKPISCDFSSINESLFETDFNQLSVTLLVLMKVLLTSTNVRLKRI